MNITFRNLEENDLPVVKEIYDWYVENSTATFHTGSISIDELREFIYIDHSVYKSFMILQDNEIAGYCFLTYFKKRQAYDRTSEVTVYLKPDFRNKGIGRLALNYLENAAKKSGLKNLIGIISGDNISSILLFEKSGYTKCAHYKNVGEKFNKVLDVVAFQKEL